MKATELPDQVARRGITEAQWRTLCNNLFPGANPNSVLMVWDYCVARRLDPLKKPCHIVPMEVKDARSNRYEWRDVVMPGIYEHRITAHRTGQYLGHSRPEYGPVKQIAGVEAPEWCEMTMYRWNPELKMRAEFPVHVDFAEVVATKKDGAANARWTKAPKQMLTKCTEAAGLREVCPEEIGSEPTAEEMEGQRAVDIPVVIADAKNGLVKPAAFDTWYADLVSVADEGWTRVEQTWSASAQELRDYLTRTDTEAWAALKTRAEAADRKASQPSTTSSVSAFTDELYLNDLYVNGDAKS